MSADWTVWQVVVAAALLALLLVAFALAVALVRTRARTTGALAAAQEQAEQLRAKVAEIERRLAPPPPPVPGDHEYLITHLGGVDDEPVPAVARPVFADMVLRESVVQAASLVAGLRRALTPETRNRIRFEVRREVKRARKQRKADQRTARREWEARERSRIDLDDDLNGAA